MSGTDTLIDPNMTAADSLAAELRRCQTLEPAARATCIDNATSTQNTARRNSKLSLLAIYGGVATVVILLIFLIIYLATRKRTSIAG